MNVPAAKPAERHECAPGDAAKMLDWIENRGGVAVWQSVNMSNLGASWSSPALTSEGQPTQRPNWQTGATPTRVITDASLVDVVSRREVQRFHVAVRVGGGGFKLTDGASRKLRAALDKAGEGASYKFDYDAQEAVITVPDTIVPLDTWVP